MWMSLPAFRVAALRFDKQFLRDWLEAQPWNKAAPAPALPAEVITQTAAKYQEALERIMG